LKRNQVKEVLWKKAPYNTEILGLEIMQQMSEAEITGLLQGYLEL
jgi:hypothetical protein